MRGRKNPNITMSKAPLRRGLFYRFIRSLLALALVDPTQYTTHPESIPES